MTTSTLPRTTPDFEIPLTGGLTAAITYAPSVDQSSKPWAWEVTAEGAHGDYLVDEGQAADEATATAEATAAADDYREARS